MIKRTIYLLGCSIGLYAGAWVAQGLGCLSNDTPYCVAWCLLLILFMALEIVYKQKLGGKWCQYLPVVCCLYYVVLSSVMYTTFCRNIMLQWPFISNTKEYNTCIFNIMIMGMPVLALRIVLTPLICIINKAIERHKSWI